MSWTKQNIVVIILFILHAVGGVGLSIDALRPLFIALTPYNLLLSFLLLMWANDNFTPIFLKTISLLFLCGYFVEVLGVYSGLLFGEYSYGKTLGFQCLDVPLIIGINWVLLMVSCYAVSSFFVSKAIIRAVLSSAIMVLLDIMIEPVAIRLDFWQWEGGDIPLQNYFMWFLVALFMNWILSFNRLKFNIKLGFGLLISQVLFFTLQSINF